MAKEEAKQFTQEDFLAMMQMFMEAQEKREAAATERMLQFAQELKKLPAHEQEKLDKQRARELESRVSTMKAAIDTERNEKQRQFNCQHIKVAEGVMKQSHAFVGQVNSDGHFKPVCCRCYRQFPKIKASDEQIRSGVGLRNVPSLTAEIILNWHLRTVPNCPECAEGHCAVKQLRELKQGFLDPAPKVLPDGKVVAEAIYA